MCAWRSIQLMRGGGRARAAREADAAPKTNRAPAKPGPDSKKVSSVELISSFFWLSSSPFYSPPSFMKFRASPAAAGLALRVFSSMYSDRVHSCQEEIECVSEKNARGKLRSVKLGLRSHRGKGNEASQRNTHAHACVRCAGTSMIVSRSSFVKLGLGPTRLL